MTATTATETATFDALIVLEADLTVARALRDMGIDAKTRERGAAMFARVDRDFDAAWMALSNGQIDRFFAYRKEVLDI